MYNKSITRVRVLACLFSFTRTTKACQALPREGVLGMRGKDAGARCLGDGEDKDVQKKGQGQDVCADG